MRRPKIKKFRGKIEVQKFKLNFLNWAQKNDAKILRKWNARIILVKPLLSEPRVMNFIFQAEKFLDVFRKILRKFWQTSIFFSFLTSAPVKQWKNLVSDYCVPLALVLDSHLEVSGQPAEKGLLPTVGTDLVQ